MASSIITVRLVCSDCAFVRADVDADERAHYELERHCHVGGWHEIGRGRRRLLSWPHIYLNRFRDHMDFQQRTNNALDGGLQFCRWDQTGCECGQWHLDKFGHDMDTDRCR